MGVLVEPVALAVCFDLEEVEDVDDERSSIPEADEQRVGRAQSNRIGILEGSQALQ